MNEKKMIRCAIYTRKSTEEGLEQDFNSLDAQRDAGEAYIASQKHEGWVCLPDHYDDGGYTGGNKATFGVIGLDPVYEEDFELTTNGYGEVTAEMQNCILRPSGAACEIKFTVLNVAKTVPVKGDLVYNESKNVCTSTTILVDEIPADPCNYIAYPITPNPAAFMSSSPFQQQMSGVYYHIMVAVVATNETGCVEYKFTCVDDDSKSSGWRSTISVAGTFYPNGTAQVPQQYWAQVSGKNQRYYWKVQYRACGCTLGDTESAPKQVPAIP
jgi:hypothetical protein